MRKVYQVFIESLKIIWESFVYLFKEIYCSILALRDSILRVFGIKKKSSNIRDLIINTEKKILEDEKDSADKVSSHSSLKSKDIDSIALKPKEEHEENIIILDTKKQVEKNFTYQENLEKGFKPEDKQLEDSLNEDTSDEDNQTPKKKSKYKYTKLFSILFIIIAVVFTYLVWDLPDYSVLENYSPPLTTRVYSEEGNLVSEMALEKRLFVPSDSIPKMVKDAFISAEDKNFYHHFGIDIWGLSRASFNNVMYLFGKAGNIEGASTITQQVVKNFLLSNDRTIKRKIREAILTMQVEKAFSKEHILELYLNEIYLGRSSYGISMASLNYFNKSIDELNLAEAAFLASLPKAPSKYDPKVAYDIAKERRDWVIGRMLIDGKITKEQAEEAIATPIDFINKQKQELQMYSAYSAEEIRKELIKNFGSDKVYGGGLVVKTTISDNLQQYAYRELRKGIINFDSKKGYRGPLDRTEQTAEFLSQIDNNKVPNWLIALENNESSKKYRYDISPWRVAIVINVSQNRVNFGLLDGTKGFLDLSLNLWAKDANNPSNEKADTVLNNFNDILQVGDIILTENYNNNWLLRQIPNVNGALIAMSPQTGEILAMQGGFSFALSQFNRSTQAMRQPGSAFKPFVYLSAIAKGRRTTDKILDAPLIIDSEDNKSWMPRNNANAYGGYVTLRNALEQSRNLATIRLANSIGLEAISETVMRLGLYDTPIDNLSEVLGSKEVTLINIVNSYASIVNGGKRVTPNLIRQVQDKDGNIIFRNDTRECLECNNVEWQDQLPPELQDNREQVINPVDAAIVVSLLQGVVERGTGRRTRFSGYNIGGKTGTTNDVKDAWFIGFTPDLVVGIYFGEDNPKSLGNAEGATSIAVPVFASFMRSALKGRESLPFRTPEGLEMKWVNYKTGEPGEPGAPGVILEVFKEGNSEGQRILTEDGRLQELKDRDSSHEIISEDGIY
ncbi:MAG: PBP1A family penicillin-binding protein [Alphaproteobacteria bacterium]|jgi:penicillin-binding protein 1A|nr:PBP1A family penicillin-binding protein [Alphaproteobacteria bacterium]